ncbi:restriction endonuclease [Candidatus Dormiibacter inghamiae]|uniref:restriction endonuclease n=1 Tax=Candidatus Dormiibacter inghamiae TaxID=3127013 RepID=UPI003312FA1B
MPSQLRSLYQIGKGRPGRGSDRREIGSAGVGDDATPATGEIDEGPVGSENWKDPLLDRLLGLSPSAFERLCQRLLKAAGFVTVIVTGRSGDGGIDGVGQHRLALLSFPVVFQSKRYRGSVGPDKVREFRGAMAGRGDKGLLITTGTFTPDASREATREGVPQIDLIDGDRLCDLLLEHRLGAKIVTSVVVDQGFLETLDKGS